MLFSLCSPVFDITTVATSSTSLASGAINISTTAEPTLPAYHQNPSSPLPRSPLSLQAINLSRNAIKATPPSSALPVKPLSRHHHHPQQPHDMSNNLHHPSS
jgi:hypothetical protein